MRERDKRYEHILSCFSWGYLREWVRTNQNRSHNTRASIVLVMLVYLLLRRKTAAPPDGKLHSCLLPLHAGLHAVRQRVAKVLQPEQPLKNCPLVAGSYTEGTLRAKKKL